VPDIHPVEEEIIRYVNENPGCSKSDVVRFIKEKQMMGRPAVLVHIDKLEREGMIICKLEKPNSQLYKIVINKENKIASVLGELESFRKAYSGLLKKSRERIDSKDYSKAAQILDIKESDPSKWQDEDKLKFLRMEAEKIDQHRKNYEKSLIWTVRSAENIHKLMDKAPGDKAPGMYEIYIKILETFEKLLSEKDPKQRSNIILGINKFLRDVERDAHEIKVPLENYIQSMHNVMDYEVAFLLSYAVFIYYCFVEIMMYRTIFVWSNDNQEYQTFSSVYSIIFRMISEMQLQLAELFSNKLHIMTESPTKEISSTIRLIRENNLKPRFLPWYYTLDMGSEIKSVANSLLSLSKEIRDYNLIDMEDFEHVNEIDGILEINEMYNIFLRFIQESKKISTIDIDSPKYRLQSEVAMQAVKKLIQLQTKR
jgi:DNA-binding transcriptional ArsR family regulator